MLLQVAVNAISSRIFPRKVAVFTKERANSYTFSHVWIKLKL